MRIRYALPVMFCLAVLAGGLGASARADGRDDERCRAVTTPAMTGDAVRGGIGARGHTRGGTGGLFHLATASRARRARSVL